MNIYQRINTDMYWLGSQNALRFDLKNLPSSERHMYGDIFDYILSIYSALIYCFHIYQSI